MDYAARMPSPAVPMVDANGVLSPAWVRWFLTLFNRTGGAVGIGAANAVLRAGDAMTGPLTLSGDPITALGAATKQYVDTLPQIGAALLAWPGAAAPTLANGTYTLLLAWPWAGGAITSLAASAVTGTFTAAVRINGVAVSGLGAVTVASPTVTTTTAGANALVAGDQLTVAVSGGDFSGDFSATDFVSVAGAALQVNYVYRSISLAVSGGFTSDFSPTDFVIA